MNRSEIDIENRKATQGASLKQQKQWWGYILCKRVLRNRFDDETVIYTEIYDALEISITTKERYRRNA